MRNLLNKDYLQGFDADSIKRIAHGEFGIALSRTVDGKRKKFTKAELIEMIIVVAGEQVEVSEQVEKVSTVETVPESIVNDVTVENVVSEIEHTVEDAETVIEQLNLSDVIPFALAKLKEIKCKQELQEFKSKLLASFDDKQQARKRKLTSKWAMQYNRLTMLFKQAEMKLQ